MFAESPETIHDLRRAVADLAPPADTGGRLMPLGVAAVDGALEGGLPGGTLHEIAPATALHGGAAGGFAAALTALALDDCRHAVWIQPDFVAAELGALYGPGLDLLGLPMARLVILRVPRPRDALWAMEEALKCRAVAAVVAEVGSAETDLTATRRLALAAREGCGLGLILHHDSPSHIQPTTATTRWEVASVRGERDRFGGLGPSTFMLSLVKNRRGRTGQWRLSWDHHERVFVAAASSLSVAQAARDGSPVRVHAGQVRAG